MSRAFLVSCLGFGDSGKGSLTDYLVRQTQADWVIRFNGGAQAAHNVVTPDGRHHRFSQFGSGSFLPGAKTFLSRFMLVDPLTMIDEAVHLRGLGVRDVWERMYIDESAPVVTPFHIAANRLREYARGVNRHGSCGMGIGETVSDFLQYGQKMLVVGDLSSEGVTKEKLGFVRRLKMAQLSEVLSKFPDREECKWLETSSVITPLAADYKTFAGKVHLVSGDFLAEVTKSDAVVFEGAQGVLLDQLYGFHPNTTWSNTTFENALGLLDEVGYSGEVVKIGLIRAYQTRHGPGPFPTEDSSLSGVLKDNHNVFNPWQRDFRVGYLDLVLARYACEVAQPDVLAVSMLDRLTSVPSWKAGKTYRTREMPEGFFDYRDREVHRIKVLPNPSYGHQERLGQLLGQCRPVYSDLAEKGDVRKYLKAVEKELGVPIAVVSFGPTAADKTMTRAQRLFPQGKSHLAGTV